MAHLGTEDVTLEPCKRPLRRRRWRHGSLSGGTISTHATRHRSDETEEQDEDLHDQPVPQVDLRRTGEGRRDSPDKDRSRGVRSVATIKDGLATEVIPTVSHQRLEIVKKPQIIDPNKHF